MNKVKIAFLDVVGLKYDGNTLNKRGLGGSESATIYMAKELYKLGFDVTVFCKAEKEGIYDGVKYTSVKKCNDNNEIFDILITLRSCVPYIPIQFREQLLIETGQDIALTLGVVQNSKHKVLWLHDTFCSGDNWLEHICIDGYFDEIFTLSDWHSNYILNGHTWRGRYFEVLKRKIWQTRNGIRNYIPEVNISQKDKNLFVYNASVSKGMTPLLEQCWGRIKQEIPDAKLMIIGGYYRGANNDSPDEQELQWMKLKEKHDGKNGVTFTGIIPQSDIAEILSKSSLMVYPNAFPETYGISSLESLNYNTPVVTCRFGALEEVATEKTSYHIDYDINYDRNQVERFVELVKKAYYDDYLRQQKMYACNELKLISSWDTVALQWKQHFYDKLGLNMQSEELNKVIDINKEVRRIFKRRFLNKEDLIEIGKENNKIIVISPVFNAEMYINKCISSVANQLYDNYEMFIIDDVSTDGTINVAKNTIDSLSDSIKNKFHIIENKEKKYAVTNQAETIEKYASKDDIIVLLDGDDWLANDNDIFEYLSNIYNKNNNIVTYGSCHSIADNIDLISQPYPEYVRNNKSYRNYLFNWGMPYTHLRTFRKSVFDRIDKSLLKDEDGNHWKAGGDNALFYPLLENADDIKCIQRVIMNYNDSNPLNDYKVNGKEQTITANKIRNYKDIGEELYDVHVGVMDRDDKSIKAHKHILENRGIVWIDDTDSAFIKPRKDWLIQELINRNISKNAKILDIGSWTGKLANDIYDCGYTNITCLDISQECTKMGKENFPYLQWIQADIEDYVTNEKFDVVLMGEIIEHLVEPFKTISKVKSWLTDNGIILYTIPTEDTVFGETENSALEHIVSINKESLEIYSDDTKILNSEGFFKWYVGSISNKKINSKTIHILIAVPTAKNIETDTFKSIYNLIKPDNCDLKFECFYGYNIDQVRNLIAHHTINGSYDYVFCVDSDIVLPKDAIIKLLSHNKDIVSGIYRQRFLNEITPEFYVYDNGVSRRATLGDINCDKLLEVSSCGFGCTLISKSLLYKIGYPQFEYHSSIDFKDTISEDTDFCIKARKCGCNIYVDTSVKCGHIGAFELKL